MNVVLELERRTDVIERKLTTVREVLDSFFSDNGEEDVIFKKEAAEAQIRELAAKPEAARDSAQRALGRAMMQREVSNHFPERYETAVGCFIWCECGWKSEPYKRTEHGDNLYRSKWQEHILTLSPSQKALDDYVAERVKAARLYEAEACAEVAGSFLDGNGRADWIRGVEDVKRCLDKRVAALRSSGEAGGVTTPAPTECLGYPYCDGDLLREAHSTACPLHGQAGESRTGKWVPKKSKSGNNGIENRHTEILSVGFMLSVTPKIGTPRQKEAPHE
jgi:hypothetical protein